MVKVLTTFALTIVNEYRAFINSIKWLCRKYSSTHNQQSNHFWVFDIGLCMTVCMSVYRITQWPVLSFPIKMIMQFYFSSTEWVLVLLHPSPWIICSMYYNHIVTIIKSPNLESGAASWNSSKVQPFWAWFSQDELDSKD